MGLDYIDPSDINDAKGKVFMLKDLNVPDNLDNYLKKKSKLF
jgi:hypothetical protein